MTIKDEIDALRKSDQVYYVSTFSKDAASGEVDLRGGVSYDPEAKQIVVSINTHRDAGTEDPEIAVFAHELKVFTSHCC